MSESPLGRADFRAAVESADLPAITHTLQRDVRFDSTVTRRPYHGLAQVTPVLQILMDGLEDFRYTDELQADAAVQALVFTSWVGGAMVQGVDLIRFGESGLVSGLTVLLQPLEAVMALAQTIERDTGHTLAPPFPAEASPRTAS
ncbi:nuclear transport factor 2 family protein [Actinomadura sp. NPDC048955]|uniref:nuclear transport factor 2 family protein n=1 Tax=Actinomadura sp. NPDC048955 TaxID=3158228 RepID=UPI0033D68CB0